MSQSFTTASKRQSTGFHLMAEQSQFSRLLHQTHLNSVALLSLLFHAQACLLVGNAILLAQLVRSALLVHSELIAQVFVHQERIHFVEPLRAQLALWEYLAQQVV